MSCKMNSAIEANQLGKRFNRFHPNKARTFKEFIIRGFRGIKPRDPFWALRDITFSVKPGRALGIMGRNGSGKSTLLHLLGGVMQPNEGSVAVRGRIGALIELGSGYQPDMTGLENVFMCGVVAGLTRREVARKIDDIVAFSELENFIDNPYRTYSSGMQMRLAFSVAAHTEPEILLIDEVLSVGDIAFQKKCLGKVTELKEGGCTMVLVTHDIDKIPEICDEALWIHAGQIAGIGEPGRVIDEYKAVMSRKTQYRTPSDVPVRSTPSGVELRANENRFGSLEVEIAGIRLLSSHGFEVSEIESGTSLKVEINYAASKPVNAPIFGVTISSRDRSDYLDLSTDSSGITLPLLQGQGKIELTLDRVDLHSGSYFVDIGVYEANWEYAYDFHWHVYPLIIHSRQYTRGILLPPHKWNFSVTDSTLHLER